MNHSNKSKVYTVGFAGFVAMAAAVGFGLWEGFSEKVPTPSRDIASPRLPVQHQDGGLERDATSMLRFKNAEIVMDNDLAMKRKIEAIRKAGKGSSIKVVYYIYHDDQSASYFSKELIAAAKRGAQVKILIDYFYNYRHLDLFSMMEREGANNNKGGKIQVRLYNRPTKNQIKDIVYMTTPCKEANKFSGCPAYKDALVNKMFQNEGNYTNINNGKSGLFFSGFYEKDPRLMAAAILEGQKLDLASLKGSGGETTEADKKALMSLLKSYWTMKTSNSTLDKLGAGFKIAMARVFFGDKVNPIFETINSIVPMDMRREANSARDWAYWTDFTHHKLLLVDNKHIMLGGRNIENSYHMQPNDMVEKYLFWDTDLYGTLSGGGEKIAQSFDELFSFRQMVATLPEIRAHAPNDIAANNRIISQKCTLEVEEKENVNADTLVGGPSEDLEGKKKEKKAAITACISRELEAGNILSLNGRMDIRRDQLETRAAEFQSKVADNGFISGKAFFKDLPKSIVLSSEELSKADTYAAYVENLPYTRSLAPAARVRAVGTSNKEYIKNGKHIHAQWVEGYKRTCQMTQDDGQPRSIILYNAYFYPSSLQIRQWADFFDGTINCKGVTMKIITNSAKSSDLGMVNSFSAHQMKGFFQYYNKAKKPNRAMEFEVYEVNGISSSAHISLHSKVTIMGDDIMIGSANTDIRSIMMDTNNSVLLRNVPNAAALYRDYFNKVLSGPGRVTRIDQIYKDDAITNEHIQLRNRDAFDKFLLKYNLTRHMSADQLKRLHDFWDALLYNAYSKTMNIMSAQPHEGDTEADAFNELFKVI